jgi:hypothetical protein
MPVGKILHKSCRSFSKKLTLITRTARSVMWASCALSSLNLNWFRVLTTFWVQTLSRTWWRDRVSFSCGDGETVCLIRDQITHSHSCGFSRVCRLSVPLGQGLSFDVSSPNLLSQAELARFISTRMLIWNWRNAPSWTPAVAKGCAWDDILTACAIWCYQNINWRFTHVGFSQMHRIQQLPRIINSCWMIEGSNARSMTPRVNGRESLVETFPITYQDVRWNRHQQTLPLVQSRFLDRRTISNHSILLSQFFEQENQIMQSVFGYLRKNKRCKPSHRRVRF